MVGWRVGHLVLAEAGLEAVGFGVGGEGADDEEVRPAGGKHARPVGRAGPSGNTPGAPKLPQLQPGASLGFAPALSVPARFDFRFGF